MRNRALTRAAVALTAVGTALTVAAMPAASATTSYSVTHAIDPHTGRSVVVRWSPCQISSTGVRTTHYISYRINPAGASSRIKLVQQALARLTTASGLHFHYLGTTTYVPHYAVLHYPTGNRYIFDAAQERRATHAELVIAWAYKSQSNLLTGSDDGVGTVSWSGSATSQLRIVQAAIVMRRGVSLRSGFQAGGSVGTLLQHELGHASGLNHVSSRSQLMYPVLSYYSPSNYGSGDVTGLHVVGMRAGCFTTPASAPADPAAIARAAGVTVTG